MSINVKGSYEYTRAIVESDVTGEILLEYFITSNDGVVTYRITTSAEHDEYVRDNIFYPVRNSIKCTDTTCDHSISPVVEDEYIYTIQCRFGNELNEAWDIEDKINRLAIKFACLHDLALIDEEL